MKKITLLLFCLSFALSIFAQNQAMGPAQQATEQLQEFYQFNAEQKQKVQTIQERRFRNMAEIAPLQNSQIDIYIKKRQAIERGTEASIKRILTSSQLELFNTKIVEKRKLRNVKTKEWYREGLSQQEIQLRLLEIE